jgi:iron complex transport system substrate-binding protein
MKKKLLASLEIAVVLCSLFLVALPAIAAEQNQATQEVSASTITTASEDDYVLEIYGNANEDDTIDMRDLTYVKLIFFGKKPETELADAKYDGKINPLDFIQIKLIIVGKEKELTIIHGNGRAKTFNLPIKRIIAIDDGQGEPLRVLESEDLVVGVGTGLAGGHGMRRHETILPKMHKLPVVGGSGGEAMNIDYEKVLSLKPDLFFTHAGGVEEGLEEKLEPYGVQVLYLSCCPIRKPDDIIKLGYLLGKVNKAKEVVDFWEGYVDKIKARTDGLPEDEKSRVFITYIGWDMTCSKGTKGDEVCAIVGGVNIAHDVIGSGTWSMYPVVDREWVVEQNPDVIITTSWGGRGYETDDPSEMEAAREEIMNRPELTNVNAVKNGNVYAVSGDFTSSGLLGIVWAA